MVIVRSIPMAWRFHTADPLTWAAEDPRSLRYGGLGLLLLAGVWAAASVGLWQVTSRLFARYSQQPTLPALALTLWMLLGPCRRGADALVNTLARGDSRKRAIPAALLALGLWCLFSVLDPEWHRSETLGWISFARPLSKIDRVLILLPFWNAWTIVILPKFSPIRDDHATAAFARSCGPLTAAVGMGALLAVTIGYFAYLPWTQLSISAAALCATFIGGAILARRAGGMTRDALLATGFLTQLALLTTFLANRQSLW